MRAVICPDKVNTEEWLDAHRTAHSVGLRSNVTIMFGTVERPVHVARHLVRTRALQKETGGFTEFVPLPFVHMATPIFLQGKARRGPTFREVLLMHAVGRIAYRGWIDNVQASWVKCGVVGARQILQAGANDLGGTLMDENISRAAGASHGQELDESEFRAIVEPLGRPLAQRTTLYGRTQTVGQRLRPPEDHAHGDGGDTPVVLLGARPMTQLAPRLDVVALGHPLVDVLAHETDDVVARAGVERGAMTMVDAARSDEIYARDGPGAGDLGRLGREHRGRASRRSAAGPRSSAAIADDTFGKVFAHDLRSVGVQFDVAARDRRLADRPLPRDRHAPTPSARCARTSAPGAELDPRDVDDDRIASAAVTYLEGYLWDAPAAKDAIRRAAVARARGRPQGRAHALRPVLRRAPPRRVPRADRVATSTSSSRTRTRSRCSTRSTPSTRPLHRVAAHCEIAALTRGAHGSVIVSRRRAARDRRRPGRRVVDTTGAGDLYAAGVPLRLHARPRSRDVRAARRRSRAAEVISHLGAAARGVARRAARARCSDG